METAKRKNLEWNFFCTVWKCRLDSYLANGRAKLYHDDLIVKLRQIEYCGVPASVILLTKQLCNGECRSRSLLMAQAFLDTEDDVKLIYADVDSLKLNPRYTEGQYEHCFVERTTRQGHQYIYDTTDGLIYEKASYWRLENPKINQIKTKQQIIAELAASKRQGGMRYSDEYYRSVVTNTVSQILANQNNHEIYAAPENNLLKREYELFKHRELNVACDIADNHLNY